MRHLTEGSFHNKVWSHLIVVVVVVVVFQGQSDLGVWALSIVAWYRTVHTACGWMPRPFVVCPYGMSQPGVKVSTMIMVAHILNLTSRGCNLLPHPFLISMHSGKFIVDHNVTSSNDPCDTSSNSLPVTQCVGGCAISSLLFNTFRGI